MNQSTTTPNPYITDNRLALFQRAIDQIGQLCSQLSSTPPQGVVAQPTSRPHEDGEVYIARGRRAGLMGAAAATSAYQIEVRFISGLNETQKNAFKAAADRWTRVIVGAVPPVMVDGEIVQGVLILAQGADIDGPGGILGQAGPTRLRPGNAGAAAFLPAKGEMTFDTADLQVMQQNGTLNDVITHEMGHVLGIGTIWTNKGVLQGAGSSNPVFVGQNAMREYGVLRGTGPQAVPVENTGGPGTRDSHWRETVFANELMTGFVASPPNPLSRMTAASLQDLGYEVDLGGAEPYQLPDLLRLAEAGALPRPEQLETGTMLPRIPIVLPQGSLR